MPIIQPVSDLRNYNEVLKNVKSGSPVYLTKNGRGKYAIYEIDDFEKKNAEAKLLLEIARGEKSAREGGWIAEDELKAALDEAL